MSSLALIPSFFGIRLSHFFRVVTPKILLLNASLKIKRVEIPKYFAVCLVVLGNCLSNGYFLAFLPLYVSPKCKEITECSVAKQGSTTLDPKLSTWYMGGADTCPTWPER